MKGNEYWMDPFSTSMIMGGRVPPCFLWAAGFDSEIYKKIGFLEPKASLEMEMFSPVFSFVLTILKPGVVTIPIPSIYAKITYISVDFYGRCRWIYQSHGWYGIGQPQLQTIHEIRSLWHFGSTKTNKMSKRHQTATWENLGYDAGNYIYIESYMLFFNVF